MGDCLRSSQQAAPAEYVYAPRADVRHQQETQDTTWSRYDPGQHGVSRESVVWLEPFPETVSTRLNYAERHADELHYAARAAGHAAPHDLTCALHEPSRERQVGEQYARMLRSLPPIRIRERTLQHAYDDERGSYVGPAPGEPWVRLRQRQDWTPEDEAELAGYPYQFDDADRNSDRSMRAQYANRLRRMPPTALRQVLAERVYDPTDALVQANHWTNTPGPTPGPRGFGRWSR